MKKTIAILTSLLIISAPAFASQSFLDKHGIWLEDTEFSWIGLQKLYGSQVSGYDKEASDSSYLDIGFDPDIDACKLDSDGNLPVEFTFNDDYGIKFKQLWVSWSAQDSRRPLFSFKGEVIDGYNNPQLTTSSKSIKRGPSYGQMKYIWECFEVPFNLRYAQPATYKLTLLISAKTAFNLRIDAVYLGDGTNEPQNRNRPLRSGIVVDNPEKVLPWVIPVTEKFDRTMVPPLDKIVRNVNLTCVKGMEMPFVLAVSGGANLGKSTLYLDNPLKNGSNTLKSEISVVSFLKKRWNRNSPVDLKTEIAEYLKFGNEAIISLGKTEFFWVNTFVPEDAKPGLYSSELRIRTENSSDYQIRFSINVIDIAFNKPDNFLIFHSTNHYLSAKNGKLDKQQAWDRYKVDFEDIVRHGIKKICLALPCITRPDFVVDAEIFSRVVGMAKNAGFNDIYVDISKPWSDCLKAKEDGLEEFKDSIEKTTGILKTNGFKPVYVIGRSISELESAHFNLLNALGKLPTKIQTAATFTKLENYDPVNIQIFDLGDFDWKYTAAKDYNTVWEPRPHWGQQGLAKIVSGIYNYMQKPSLVAISEYQSTYGNPFDDFDLRLGDGSYTPGDLTMAYKTESYELMTSLKWECFKQGLSDWGMMDKLASDPQKTSNFTRQIPTQLSSRMCATYCTPGWQEWFWIQGMRYLEWMVGGIPVEPEIVSRIITFTLQSKTFYFDDKPSQMTVEPTVISGKTYIPARYLIEPLGGEVIWDQATKTITANALNHQIKLVIGSKKALQDGASIDMSDSPVIVSGRTLIPLRSASTLLGASVEWNANTRTAKIKFDVGKRF